MTEFSTFLAHIPLIFKQQSRVGVKFRRREQTFQYYNALVFASFATQLIRPPVEKPVSKIKKFIRFVLPNFQQTEIINGLFSLHLLLFLHLFQLLLLALPRLLGRIVFTLQSEFSPLHMDLFATKFTFVQNIQGQFH